MKPAIEVISIGKRFRRYHPDRPRTLQEALLRGMRGLRPEEEFWALREVSFQVDPGRMVGVVGRNGAGKSTLLRVVGGVIVPDAGSLHVSRRVGALIDLGAGFHPDLNGRENIYINGIISGLTRKEVDDQFDSIVDFSELEDFIDSPLRTYSTGMQLRLAFAVATHMHPEILLIDEILSVGDLAFQSKCIERIKSYQSEGCAILVVSHDTNLMSKMCNELLWLSNGQVVAYGPPEKIAQQYMSEMRVRTGEKTPPTGDVAKTRFGTVLQLNENRFGSLEMQITDVTLRTRNDHPTIELGSGDPLQVAIAYNAPQPVESPIFTLSISKEDGTVCFDTSTALAGLSLPKLTGSGVIKLDCERLDLAGGNYFVDVGVHRHDWSYAYDYHWHVYPLTITQNAGGKGILQPPLTWKIDA
jgi:lipopolysaccharide transport system ATP-binding protein